MNVRKAVDSAAQSLERSKQIEAERKQKFIAEYEALIACVKDMISDGSSLQKAIDDAIVEGKRYCFVDYSTIGRDHVHAHWHKFESNGLSHDTPPAIAAIRSVLEPLGYKCELSNNKPNSTSNCCKIQW